jgi:S-adenosylmethionine hydrolase
MTKQKLNAISINKIRFIVVISDCTDVAYNEVRAILFKELGENSKRISIEPLVKVLPFSILNGSFLLRLLAEVYSPKNTLFLVILNPLRKRPARIMGETKNGIRFIGANTGVFNWLIEDFGLKSLYEIKDMGFIPFGGKYVHTPTAAQLVIGKRFEDLGFKRDKSFLAQFKIRDNTVVHIDNFGLIKIKGKQPLYKEGDLLDIYVNGNKRISAVFARRMMNLKDNEWVGYLGSSLGGMPELGKVRRTDGAKELGVRIGDIITWEKK